jgi:hypothetical protein
MMLEKPSRRRLKPALAVPLLCALLAWPCLAMADPDGDDDDQASGTVTGVVITARRLDSARADIDPALGASAYSLTNEAVERMPGGETTSLAQVLLQAPGVAPGVGGPVIRGDGRGPQYRINNVTLPEGLSDIGQILSPRMADRIELITGALPAQYGLGPAAVVSITTKSGVYQDGGQAELYGGGQGEIEPAIEFSGQGGGNNLFLSASLRRSRAGLGGADAGRPLHDRSSEAEGFLLADRPIGDDGRLSLMLGLAQDRFQLPNPHGRNALTDPVGAGGFQRPLTLGGGGGFPSKALDRNQRQAARFVDVSYLHAEGPTTLQVSLFAHESTADYHPDPTGDLLFSGVADDQHRRQATVGLQTEGVWRMSPGHALRGGIFLQSSRFTSRERAAVLPLNGLGVQTATTPLILAGEASETERQTGVFLQDAWTPVASLTVNAGLRFDQASGAAGRFSPRLGLVWTSGQATTVHAGYARYVLPAPREPDALPAAAFAATTGAPPSPAGSPVPAETDDYVDVGLQQRLGDLTLGLDAYRRNAENLHAEGRFGFSPLGSAFSYRRARLEGVEASLLYADGPLSAWANLSLARARGQGVSGGRQAFTPAQLAALDGGFVRLSDDQTYTASAGAAWRIGALKFSGDLLYGSGARRTRPGGAPNGAGLPAYAVVNLGSVWGLKGPGGRHLDLRLDVINLFDARYQLSDSAALGAGPSVWGARRGVFVGFEQAF